MPVGDLRALRRAAASGTTALRFGLAGALVGRLGATKARAADFPIITSLRRRSASADLPSGLLRSLPAAAQ